MTEFLQWVEERKQLYPSEVESYSPPNFVHPFDDPELFLKLKNDRRSRGFLNDSKFLAFAKEVKEKPETFE